MRRTALFVSRAGGTPRAQAEARAALYGPYCALAQQHTERIQRYRAHQAVHDAWQAIWQELHAQSGLSITPQQ